ncbi:MAG: stage II sporulation protein M [Thermoprotei archaeon]
MNPFAKYTLITFAVEVFVFIVAASLPATNQPELISTYHNLTRAVNGSLLNDFVLIFSNNAVVNVGSSIPFVGVVIMLIAIFQTGQVISAVASSLLGDLPLVSNVAGGLLAFVLLLMPHGAVELLSYAMASAVSLRTAKFLLSRYRLTFTLKYFFYFLLLSLFNLAVAAALESLELTISTNSLLLGLIITFGLWIFALPYLIALYFVQKRIELRLLASRRADNGHSPQPSTPQP